MGDLISIDRARKPASRDQLEEARMETAIRNAESLLFAKRVASHCRAALFALSRPQPDEHMAEHHLSQAYRLALQESIRASAEEPEPGPAAIAVAA
jgi:hypothetical protein